MVKNQDSRKKKKKRKKEKKLSNKIYWHFTMADIRGSYI